MAPFTTMRSGYPSPEVYFAQHLASNDTKIRKRAVKKLRTWLSSKGSANFTEEDFLKLWKGLFYCMWMCDKPLNQEALAEDISELIHCFVKENTCMLFIDTFFQSMSKEWHGIDKYRIEKFMFLVRKFLLQCFCFLERKSWEPKQIIELLKVFKKHILNPQEKEAIGLKMHITDIFLDELAKAGGCNLKPKRFMRFLKPYIIFVCHCNDNAQVNAVVKDIFHALIWQSFHEDDEDDAEETVVFQVNFNAIADELLKQFVSAEKQILARNKKVIYKLVSHLRTAARGEFPFRSVDSDDDNEDFKLKKSDISKAARELVKKDLEISEESRERKRNLRRKRKEQRKVEDEENDFDEPESGLTELTNSTEYVTTRKEKRKRRK